ncbi:MAG: hypothetical protein ACI4QG_05005, partial [Candidatus Cryptobacteroides sp.]
MKRYFFAFAIAATAAVSCARDVDVETDVTSPEGLMYLEATLGEQTKTVIGAVDGTTLDVMFTSSDKLFVYGNNGSYVKGTVFRTTEEGRSQTKTFSSEDWPEGYTPIYAVATTNESTLNTCTSEGVITMTVNNARQKLDWSGSYASNSTTHVGKVGEDGKVNLKNVCSLLGFKISGKDD